MCLYFTTEQQNWPNVGQKLIELQGEIDKSSYLDNWAKANRTSRRNRQVLIFGQLDTFLPVTYRLSKQKKERM